MAGVGKDVQFEDARRALRKAISDRHGVDVKQSDWTQRVPGKSPPAGYDCDGRKWTATLRAAAALMGEMGYAMHPVSVRDGGSAVSKPLTDSVRLLFDKIRTPRIAWARFQVDLEVA
ncbi:hypothetical protein LDO26_00825 [Luteimonas sp. BDR2-5]|uniref:hypothetical protein n=1 Tax=Proluteimonas luteida TaxID=2878685 RepID=UPI001E552989|nr:hypothetical protein [Luteimonas sp. BDR2-5]MCD9026758.1 hypothetical protein [Luteimonas sp. BDR2-5]